jgi:DNA-directed RNA polymerase specialized sigma24 family protein
MSSLSTREPTGWAPVWNETFMGYAINFIRENKWKCEAIHEFDDLLQDAYLTFRRVKASYPRVSDPKHFMALFKVALRNEMIDRARFKQQKSMVEAQVDDEQYKALSECIGGGEDNLGYLMALLNELPPEAKLLLQVMNDEKKSKQICQRRRSNLAKAAGLPKTRENLNMILCRILKLPKGTDLMGPLKKALGGET